MAIATPTSTLAADGLTEDQRLHFAEHGWVLFEDFLDEQQCAEYVDAVDAALARFAPRTSSYDQFSRGRQAVMEPIMCDARFADIYTAPGFFEAAQQLIGFDDVRYNNSLATVTPPSGAPESEHAALTDPSTFAWHRDHRPRWNVFEDDDDPRFVVSSVIATTVFFTPASKEDGVTAILDGSHRADGPWRSTPDTWAALRDDYPVSYPTAGPGCLLMFSESLVHSATHVLSDRRRVALFSWMNAAWMAADSHNQPHLIERYADERLRNFFRRPESGAYFLDPLAS